MKNKRENKMNKPYKILLILASLVVVVLVGLFSNIKRVPGIEIISIAIIVVILAVIFIGKYLKTTKDAKKGLTIEDERSRKVLLLTGAKAFQISMWYLFVLIWVSGVLDIITLNASTALASAMVGMAIIFGITWLWANKQEDLDIAVRF
jgi:peptidoglycan/LPS O-acetylase OafA/YrhL